MKKELVSKADIDKYKHEKEIIAQTAQQVIKDFGIFGIDINLSGNTELAYDELYNQLVSQIATLLKKDNNKLQAIL